MFYLVYKITNGVNGKIYVGVHRTEDKGDGYFGSSRILKLAIKKYGIQHFTKETLYECISSKEMFKKESEIVNKSFVGRCDTYNAKTGGYGGWDYINNHGLNPGHDQCCEHIQKLKTDPEYVKFFSQRITDGLLIYFSKHDPHFKGEKHTIVSKRKIGNANSIHQKGKGNSQYGKCWIYSLDEKRSISIKKEDLDQYINDGWVKGRKMKFN